MSYRSFRACRGLFLAEMMEYTSTSLEEIYVTERFAGRNLESWELDAIFDLLEYRGKKQGDKDAQWAVSEHGLNRVRPYAEPYVDF
jgi:hypothetical protein